MMMMMKIRKHNNQIGVGEGRQRRWTTTNTTTTGRAGIRAYWGCLLIVWVMIRMTTLIIQWTADIRHTQQPTKNSAAIMEDKQ